MKKIINILLCAFMLMGCGSSKPKVEKTRCSMDVYGMEIAYTVSSENDVVKELEIYMSIPESLMEVDLSELSEEEKATLESEMLEGFVDETIVKKPEISYLEDSLTFVYTLNVEEDKETIESMLGEEMDEDDLNVENVISNFESMDLTCEVQP